MGVGDSIGEGNRSSPPSASPNFVLIWKSESRSALLRNSVR